MHTPSLQRRSFIAGTSIGTAILWTGRAFPQTFEAPPQLPPDLVKQYVSKSHADFEAVKELSQREPMLVRASWDQGAGDWETGLGAASHMGRRDIARFLIDKGARVDAFAVFMLGEMPAAKALLSVFPALHTVPGPHGISLLSHAIVGRKGSFDAFQLLIDARADVNAAAWRGITPLMQAVLVDEPDMVRMLLEKGANVSAKTPAGLTALDFARKRNSNVIIEMLTKS